jgi:hypothetical protein
VTITRGLLTIDEAVSYVGKNQSVDTAELEDAVTAVSRKIERFCGRHFDQITEARTFEVEDESELELGPFNDLVSVTTLKTDSTGDGVYETTIASTAYQLEPYNAALRDEPYTELCLIDGSSWPTSSSLSGTGRENVIQITGVWGWPAVPAEVKQAARHLLNFAVKLQDAPLGVAGGMDMGAVYVGGRLPPFAVDLLRPYVHPLYVGLA